MTDRSSERWSQLRFVVSRNSNGSAEWTIVHHLALGRRVWDRRLFWGRIECAPGSPESTDPLAALATALKAASKGASEGQAAAPRLFPRSGRRPLGGHGGDPE